MIAVLAWTWMLATGCQKQGGEETAAAVQEGCAVESACAVGDAVTVTVTEVVDSRCPQGAACMWAGDAAVSVQVGTDTVVLHSNPSVGPATAVLSGGQTLVLNDVVPHPSVDGSTASVRVLLAVQ